MLAITVLILNLVVISSCDHKVLSQELIDFINSLNTTWKAGHNFPGWDEEHLHRLCGVLEGDVKLPLLEIKPFNAIPSSFDSRYQWPNCPTIREIYNQGNCGSCWAVSSAHAMSDRYCTAFRTQVSISAQDLLTCCSSCGNGKYWVNYGIVTGGSYGSNKGCQPYEYAPSDCFDCHSKWTFNCDRTCRRTYPVKYKNDKHYGSTYYRVPFTVSKIQTEIMTNGPVTASFDVYKDFYSYRSGVYQHTYGSKNGGHAVKIIGWGVENKIPYWLVANSWGTSWGQKGYFKIYRGKNECGIESKINAGKPRNIR